MQLAGSKVLFMVQEIPCFACSGVASTSWFGGNTCICLAMPTPTLRWSPSMPWYPVVLLSLGWRHHFDISLVPFSDQFLAIVQKFIIRIHCHRWDVVEARRLFYCYQMLDT